VFSIRFRLFDECPFFSATFRVLSSFTELRPFVFNKITASFRENQNNPFFRSRRGEDPPPQARCRRLPPSECAHPSSASPQISQARTPALRQQSSLACCAAIVKRRRAASQNQNPRHRSPRRLGYSPGRSPIADASNRCSSLAVMGCATRGMMRLESFCQLFVSRNNKGHLWEDGTHFYVGEWVMGSRIA
jgi:hypothetical protein